MDYPWMDDVWKGQAAAAEKATAPILNPGKLWADKPWVYAQAVQGGFSGAPWPLIPRVHNGAKVRFGGQPAVRVYLTIADGPEKRDAPLEAAIQVSLPEVLAQEASLTKDDELLVVPWEHWRWLTNVRKFEAEVMSGLPWDIDEESLDHKDIEKGWFNWIAPMKKADRALYYAILPTIGVHPVLDTRKGNPDLFAPLKTSLGEDPNQPAVWWIVRKIFQQGIESWGEYRPGRDGATEILVLKKVLYDYLHSLADQFQEESFELDAHCGALERSTVNRARGDGFGLCLPEVQKKALWAKWLERADIEDGLKPAVRAMRASRLFGYGQALTQILRHAGQGWTNPQEWGDLLVTLAWRAECLSGAAELRRMQRTPAMDKKTVVDVARKLYIAGKISWRELVVFGEASGKADAYADEDLWKGLAKELEVELEGEPKRPGILAKLGLYFKD